MSTLVAARGRRPDSRPGKQIGADTGMAIDTSLATCAGHHPSGHHPSGGRSFRKQRTVNPPIVPTRYNFLYSSSRPALRAAACGGRPRAGSHTTATGQPASPSREVIPHADGRPPVRTQVVSYTNP